MDKLKGLLGSPVAVRVLPFFVFAGITTLGGLVGEGWRYWLYLAKCLAGAWIVWAVWPMVKEARWSFSWEGLGIGIGVFVLWVAMDPFYGKWMKGGEEWNPFNLYGKGSLLGWFLVLVRILGSTLIVPPIEELFYRSFLYRYVIKADFLSVPLKTVHWPSFVVVSVMFGAVHREWLAGIVCGAAYQYLVIRHGRLNEAMLAHATTNFLLGVYVVMRGAWQFW
jgi:uncharacterized protein